jgi:hypothetical protein
MEDNLIRFEGAEAMEWAWNNLWSREEEHCRLDLLDAISRNPREGGEIVSWLFTASDGLLKSKSSFRWNSSSVIDKGLCSQDTSIRAQEYVRGAWRQLRHKGGRFSSKKSTAIVLFSRIENPFFFVESHWSRDQDKLSSSHTVFRICGEDIKGRIEPLDSDEEESNNTRPYDMPDQRMRSKEKVLNVAAGAKLRDLAALLESRSRYEVRSFSCIYLVEKIPDLERGGSIYRLWLHSVSSILLDAHVPKKSIKIKPMEQNSLFSSTVEPQNFSKLSRPLRCGGDFCSYNDYVQAQKPPGDASAEFSQYSDNFGKNPTLKSPPKADNTLDTRDPTEQSTSLVMKSSQGYRVPQKLIILARHDMLELNRIDSIGDEDLEMIVDLEAAVPWPESLKQWWRSVGRDIHDAKPMRIVIPLASKFLTQSGESADLNTQTLSTASASLGGSMADSVRQYGLDPWNMTRGSNSSTVYCEKNGGPIGSNEVVKGGDINWYYSAVHVCERCYTTYLEIDLMRKKKLWKNNRAKNDITPRAASPSKEESSLIFQRQQQYMKRLSAEKLKLKSSRSSDSPSLNSKSIAGAPRGALPPLPWRLSEPSAQQDLLEQGNSFVRNLKNRAHHIATENRMHDPSESERTAEMWAAQFNRSQSAGEVSSGDPKMAQKPARGSLGGDTLVAKPFDSKRLLHPWQRDAADMKQRMMSDDKSWNAKIHKRHETLTNPLILTEKPMKSIRRGPKGGKMGMTMPSSKMDGLFRTTATFNGNMELGPGDANASLGAIVEEDSVLSVSPKPGGKAVTTSKSKAIDFSMLSKYKPQPMEANLVNATTEKKSNLTAADDDDEPIGWSPFVVPL